MSGLFGGGDKPVHRAPEGGGHKQASMGDQAMSPGTAKQFPDKCGVIAISASTGCTWLLGHTEQRTPLHSLRHNTAHISLMGASLVQG